MPSDRSQLAFHLLEDFATWACAEQGYTREPTKGEYEVLRLRGPRDSEPIIWHFRHGPMKHVTTPYKRPGHKLAPYALVKRFIRWRRQQSRKG